MSLMRCCKSIGLSKACPKAIYTVCTNCKKPNKLFFFSHAATLIKLYDIAI